MTGSAPESTPDAELRTVARELYGALLEARPCVYNRLCEEREAKQPAAVETLTRILDRVDGALADASDFQLRGAS